MAESESKTIQPSGRPEMSLGLAFLGSSKQKMDAKGRIVLPARWKNPLRAATSRLPTGTDKELALMPHRRYPAIQVFNLQEFDWRANIINAWPQDQEELETFRMEFNDAQIATLDPDGRLLLNIDKRLREYAHLTPGKELTITGQYDKFEIWNTEYLQLRLARKPIPHQVQSPEIPLEYLRQVHL